MATEEKCPACGGEAEVVASFGGTPLWKCSICHWLFSPDVVAKPFIKTGLSDEKRNEYLAIVQKAITMTGGVTQSKVLDINSGDGTLLGWYKKKFVTVGVESNAALMKEALNDKRVDVPVFGGFTPETAEQLLHVGKFQIITVIDTFQDMNPFTVLSYLRKLLADNGVLVIQTPYFPQLVPGREDFTPFRNYILMSPGAR